MSKIITRTVKGASVSQSENDVNMEAISGLNLLESGATYTVDIDDQNNTIELTSASAVAVTLDEIAVIIAAANTSDFKVTLIAVGAGAVTITPDAADSINSGDSTIVLSQNQYVTIQNDSTNIIWNIIGSNFIDVSGIEGLTSTVDELNILDGATVTADELNYNDGATSGTTVTDGDHFSGSWTSSSLAANATTNVDITHGLGTDDVLFIATAHGSDALGSGGELAVAALVGTDKRMTYFGMDGAGNTAVSSLPATGNVRIFVTNRGATSQTITVNYKIVKK